MASRKAAEKSTNTANEATEFAGGGARARRRAGKGLPLYGAGN